MSNPETTFEQRILEFLTALCRRKTPGVTIEPDTHLFETKLIDSVLFLEVMMFLEAELGVEVPERKLSAQFFLTPRIITEHFGPLAHG
jgi:acyl carrier protein